MVDERVVESSRIVAELLECRLDLALDLVVVLDILELQLALLLDAELERSVQVIDELDMARTEEDVVSARQGR